MGSRESGADDLVLPFIFVPKGGEVPADRLAAHPGALRIPATMVARGSAAGSWQLQFDPLQPSPRATAATPTAAGMLVKLRPVRPWIEISQTR